MELKKQTKKELKKIEKREIKKKDLEWRDKVKKRDNYQCAICSRKEFLDCHHILPREIKSYRWTLENGILLCKKHHRFSREISPHSNSFIFFIWFIKNRKEQYKKLLKLIKGNKLVI
jgi:5-methylcytosine-specific restriction endonuclease McrA